MSKPTTRNLSNNDACSTGCHGLTPEQTVEVNNGKDFERNDGLFNIPLEEGKQFEQSDKGDDDFVSLDDLDLD